MSLQRGKYLKQLSHEQQMARLRKRIHAGCKVIESGCWKWVRSKTSVGYAQIRLVGTMTGAHRAAYMAFVGPIPEGLGVCHSCDVKDCVNPSHLFLGTQKDNMDDFSNKYLIRDDLGRFQRKEA